MSKIVNDVFRVAAQMWCLLRFLPLMVGHSVPIDDPHWENFLLLLTILDYVMAPVISLSNVALLRLLINQHHCDFKCLYPSCSITPMFHYIVHYPEFICR